MVTFGLINNKILLFVFIKLEYCNEKPNDVNHLFNLIFYHSKYSWSVTAVSFYYNFKNWSIHQSHFLPIFIWDTEQILSNLKQMSLKGHIFQVTKIQVMMFWPFTSMRNIFPLTFLFLKIFNCNDKIITCMTWNAQTVGIKIIV